MTPVDDPDPLVGQKLAGRYHVQRRLEQGGMGAIYLATQEPLGREVAVKLLRREHATDVTALGRFEKEARAASALAHPHIVTIYDFGQTGDGQLYLAMEYLRGRSLRQVLDEDGPLPWPRALHVVRGIARGLVEAHRRGIMHRDLKPENVMLVRAGDDEDFVKLLDFGLARSVQRDEQRDARLTQQNTIPGTPGYMPPERINGVDDDLRSDLYSLGAVWYELLTGRIPFEADTAVRILVRHLQDPPPRASDHAPHEVPSAVDELVLRLLAKSPAERPPSADALLKELSHATAGKGWSVASAGQIAREATHEPAAVSEWASEPSVDLRFAPATASVAPGDEDDDHHGRDEPIALTRRKPPRASTPPEDTLQEAVVLLTRKKAPPVKRGPIESLAETAERLAAARSLDEVGAVTVDFLRARFDRAALVDLRTSPLHVVDAWGLAPREQLAAAIASFAPLHRAVSTGEAYYGAAYVEDGWRAFHRSASGCVPGGVLFAALRRNGRPALLIYAEHDRETLDVELAALGRLLKELAATLTTLRY